MKALVTNIKYDTDGEKINLPKVLEFDIPINMDEEERLDFVSDEISSSEWDYGLQLIDEDGFQEYCEDLVSDIGDLPKDLPSYISNNIDWSGVADDLRQDYSEVKFRGTTYLYR